MTLRTLAAVLLCAVVLAGCGTSNDHVDVAYAPMPTIDQPDPVPVSRNISYESNGNDVRIEAFVPEGEVHLPAVLLLHGASGIGRGEYLYPTAERLKEQGVAAFVVHYYDGMNGGRKSSPAHYGERDRILKDAITHVASLPVIDEDRIGLFGLSLGGFHALGLGMQDERVAAVVSVGGALSSHLMREGQFDAMPPTLFIHGENDRVVPLRRVQELTRELDRVGAPYYLHVYNGHGHSFSNGTLEDTIHRAARFQVEALTTSPDIRIAMNN